MLKMLNYVTVRYFVVGTVVIFVDHKSMVYCNVKVLKPFQAAVPHSVKVLQFGYFLYVNKLCTTFVLIYYIAAIVTLLCMVTYHTKHSAMFERCWFDGMAFYFTFPSI